MTSTITVVVPTINSAKVFEWTLLSLASQMDCQTNVIVADSGSNDGTLELCHRYNVKVIDVPPGNMYQAINSGLKLSITQWITYLNSDDLVYRNSYARLITYGDSINADIVYGSCDFIDEEGRFLHSYLPGYPNEMFSHMISAQFSFCQPASIFRREVFEQLNGFDEKYNLTSDLDFFLRSFIRGYKFAMLRGESVSCFRIRSNQLSQQKNVMKLQNKSIRMRYGKPSIIDLCSRNIWRLRNWPNYIIRILRYKTMKGRYKFIKTIDM
jgi:glycosyltransferase involved in cell wall biosynthesis